MADKTIPCIFLVNIETKEAEGSLPFCSETCRDKFQKEAKLDEGLTAEAGIDHLDHFADQTVCTECVKLLT